MHTNSTEPRNPSYGNVFWIVAVFLAVCTCWWTTLKAPDGQSNHCDWLFNYNQKKKEKQKTAYDNKGERAHTGPFKDVSCEGGSPSALREWKTTLFTLISSVDWLCSGLPVSHRNFALHINDDPLLVWEMIVSTDKQRKCSTLSFCCQNTHWDVNWFMWLWYVLTRPDGIA